MQNILKNKINILIVLLIAIVVALAFYFSTNNSDKVNIKNFNNVSLKNNHLILDESNFDNIKNQETKQEKLKAILYKDNQEVNNKYTKEGLLKTEDIKIYNLISNDFQGYNDRKEYPIEYLPLKSLVIPEEDLKKYQDSSQMVLFVPNIDNIVNTGLSHSFYQILGKKGDTKNITLADGKSLLMVRTDFKIKRDGIELGIHTGNKALEDYIKGLTGEKNKRKLLEFDKKENKEKFENSVI